MLKNSVDADQVAFKKPADQDPHCFQSPCKYMQIIEVCFWQIFQPGK